MEPITARKATKMELRVLCPLCGADRAAGSMYRHMQTDACKNARHQDDTVTVAVLRVPETVVADQSQHVPDDIDQGVPSVGGVGGGTAEDAILISDSDSDSSTDEELDTETVRSAEPVVQPPAANATPPSTPEPCPVCFDVPSTTVTFPCAHSLCFRCTAVVMQTWEADCAAARHPERLAALLELGTRCPLCRLPFPI